MRKVRFPQRVYGSIESDDKTVPKEVADQLRDPEGEETSSCHKETRPLSGLSRSDER
jgi:hypothetical protein